MSVMPDAAKRSGPSAARAALKIIGTLHRLLYRCSGGRMGGTLRGGLVLLLTTTGRKTGQERTWPLCYLPASGDELVLVASAGGAPRHPAWYLILRADPRVSVRSREGSRKMVARIAVVATGIDQDAFGLGVVRGQAATTEPPWTAASRELRKDARSKEWRRYEG